ncbi:MAG: type II secretion system protein M [Halieaceae bacterium]|nr:type II secretion system protein M [Halieaceae bacterium]MCP5204590.1 type II secretion system protein M [Pseudomonadales bacterium]
MKEWFAGLNQREQLSVLVLAVALGLYLLYMLAWAPLADRREQLAQQNQGIATSLQRVDAMVSEIMRLRDEEGVGGPQRNLTALVNQSTSRRGLDVSRLQPNSRGDIQVRLEGAAFDELVAWLDELESREGLLVTEVAITQSGSPGRVNATIRISQA